MPATGARGGYGTLLQRGDGATPTEVFTTIAEVMDVDGPERKVNFDDATNMESPDQHVEVVPTIKETGPVTFQVNLLADNSTHALLTSDLDAMRKGNWRLILAGGTKRFEFAAYVESIGASMPVKGKMVRPVTLRLTGKASLVANS
ncbi:MAG: phage tail tube protein [Phycisphaerales bacterium]